MIIFINFSTKRIEWTEFDERNKTTKIMIKSKCQNGLEN